MNQYNPNITEGNKTTSQTAMFVLDKKWHFIKVNKRAEELLRIKRKNILGKYVGDVFPQSLGSVFQKEARKAMQTQQETYFTAYYPPLSLWTNVSMYPAKSHLTICFKNITGTHEETLEKLQYQSMLINSVSDAIISTTPDFTITNWNKGAEQLYGWKEEEALGKNLVRLVNVKTDSNVKNRRLLNKSGQWEGTTIQITKQGKTAYVHVHVTALLNMLGETIGYVSINTDVTQQWQIEQQHLFSTSILQNVTDSILVADLDTNIYYWNKGAEQLYGWKEKEIIGKKLSVLYPKGESIHYDSFRKEIMQGKEYTGEERRMTKNGRVIWVNVHTSVMRDKNQRITGFIGISNDITQKKKTEEKLQENEQIYKRLVSTNIIGINLTDVYGHVYETNDAFLSIIGYSREEFFKNKMTWLEITPKKYRTTDQQAVKKLLEKGYATPWEKEFIRKDGSLAQVVTGVALLDKDSKKCISFILDISQRKELEQRKDDFIAMTSHELKTPLTTLGVYTHMLSTYLKQHHEKKVHDAMKKVEEQKVKLEKLITNLLDISKIQSGQLIAEKTIFSLSKLITDTASMMQQSNPTHTIKINIPKKRISVYADKERTTQVLINLLSNAIKYSPHGKNVIIALSQMGKQVQVCIQDFGIGIEETEVNKIFDRFYRGGKEQAKTYPGLGIGLYLSSQIITKQGGRMWVKSEKEKGSTFCFSLPKSKTA